MANVDEKAFIKKQKHTNKRAGFDINQANYLGNNLKKNERVAPALILTYVYLCQIFKWHTIRTLHLFTKFTVQPRMLHKNANAITIGIHALTRTHTHTRFQKISLNFYVGFPFIDPIPLSENKVLTRTRIQSIKNSIATKSNIPR